MIHSKTKALLAAPLLTAIVLAGTIDGTAHAAVWDPTITFPTAGAVWIGGTTHTVTWSLRGEPTELTDKTGVLYLEHNGIIDVDHPLASGFSMLAGHVSITMPFVLAGEYRLVLLGDSGDQSPVFIDIL